MLVWVQTFIQSILISFPWWIILFQYNAKKHNFFFFFSYLAHFSMIFSLYFHYTLIWKVNRMKNWKYKHKQRKEKKKLVRLPVSKNKQGNLNREVNDMSPRPRIWENTFKCLSLQSISKSSVFFQQFLILYRKCQHLDL